MNKKVALYSAISFLIGSAIGAGCTFFFKMKQYDSTFRKRQEEMETFYRNKEPKSVTPVEPEGKMIPIKIEKKANMMEEARKIAADQGYIKKKYNKVSDQSSDEDVESKPYVISMNEFGSEEMYEIDTWHLYSDGVITDDSNEPVDSDDVASFVSLQAIDMLKNSNSDSIYIRNERLRKDFEIIEEIGRYADE